MAAKFTRLTHKVAIQLHPVVESCTICSSRSRRPVWKLLDTPSYDGKLPHPVTYVKMNHPPPIQIQNLERFRNINMAVYCVSVRLEENMSRAGIHGTGSTNEDRL